MCARGTYAAKQNRLSMTDVQRNTDACNRGLRIARFAKRPTKLVLLRASVIRRGRVCSAIRDPVVALSVPGSEMSSFVSWPQLTGAKVTQTVEQRRQNTLLMTWGPYGLLRIVVSIGLPIGSIHTSIMAAHPPSSYSCVSGFQATSVRCELLAY